MPTPGQRFGRWLVLEASAGAKVVCRCDCGTERSVLKNSLKQGRSRSCGCIAVEINAARARKHGCGASDKKLLDVYHSMLARCNKPTHAAYKNYGGRGIQVCERWLSSPLAFFADMAPRPDGAHLDRINNDKGYSPDNCRWATPQQNKRNRRITTYLTCNGETLSTSDWADRSGISARQILDRVRAGWSAEKAIFTPVTKSNRWLRNKGV